MIPLAVRSWAKSPCLLVRYGRVPSRPVRGRGVPGSPEGHVDTAHAYGDVNAHLGGCLIGDGADEVVRLAGNVGEPTRLSGVGEIDGPVGRHVAVQFGDGDHPPPVFPSHGYFVGVHHASSLQSLSHRLIGPSTFLRPPRSSHCRAGTYSDVLRHAMHVLPYHTVIGSRRRRRAGGQEHSSRPRSVISSKSGRDALSLSADLDVALDQDGPNARIAALPTNVVAERVFRSVGRDGHPVGRIAGQHAPGDGEWPHAVVRLAAPLGSRDLGTDCWPWLGGATRQRKRSCSYRQHRPNPHSPTLTSDRL